MTKTEDLTYMTMSRKPYSKSNYGGRKHQGSQENELQNVRMLLLVIMMT